LGRHAARTENRNGRSFEEAVNNIHGFENTKGPTVWIVAKPEVMAQDLVNAVTGELPRAQVYDYLTYRELTCAKSEGWCARRVNGGRFGDAMRGAPSYRLLL
jgi:hypothetical protein